MPSSNFTPAEVTRMVAECDLPYKLNMNGVYYNLLNGGNTTLVSIGLDSIGGASPNTSWVMYSCQPTSEEVLITKTVEKNIGKSVGKTKTGKNQSSLQETEDPFKVVEQKEN
ncbi:uncharacterized protein MELLADRAFT_69743 [Melampsora larici-populina 98AG31]|uniref:Uncharacterized protein n=1 Tax=Melampsora larici-populina (strain 98AG31 / pathotype 3-4-7) TaxID=747676 RepID=F4SC05_MELLP|nr:uncharacterized protein MELLADRAFT_69743 [Melampsora larici-populina 98AG31]EGF97797.1 hypothetical protein MELLADRAFT_69743 [Melampsora larici-populina 98AG31]